MTTVNVRDLQRDAARILHSLEENGKPVFVTRNGKPVAVLAPVDDDALLEYVAEHVPGFLPSMDEVRERRARGETGVSLQDAIAALEAEETGEQEATKDA